ncbi:putative disease resistance protein RGA1 [Hordeum vulgare subsp. vulgare]|uniref:putative disease resistance protein RGA1 n=1 Tax=Hordeum vulgare subsp. vulgare TaxID=112509 RepID=UPI000B46E912|nr:putative disease resistance protein RGA1 [Hordeum vulgare subsp. vulgare]
MSPNFRLLNNLHILTTFVVGTGDGLGIEQLKDLQNLSNKLELLNLDKIKGGENAKEANLSQKQNLSELLFTWDQKIDDDPRDVEEVLQCLEPHSNIQKLEIRGYHGLEISQWMRKPQMFDCLRELKMFGCPKCKSIPVIWFSVSLEILVLERMDNLITLCNNLDAEAGGCITPLRIFPGLKKMRLIQLPSLEMWAENSMGEPSCDNLVTFPMLEELKIKNCPKLASTAAIPVVSKLSIVGAHSTAVGSVFTSIRLGSWPFLVSLTLGSLEDIPMLPLDAQQSQSERPLEKLESLTLKGPNSLIGSSGLSCQYQCV